MGKLISSKRYLYIANGAGLSPNINGLRFYDSGLIQLDRPIYYDETNTYKLRWVAGFWALSRIDNTIGDFVRFNISILGDYTAASGWSGTLTISEYKNNISIKKQNATFLKPYSINGGTTEYDANAVYIFKGGSINTVSTVFSYLELQGGSSYSTADGIYIPSVGSYIYYKNSGIGGTGWRTNAGADATNLVINNNDLIYFTPRSNKQISVGSGAIIQKYNSGKISLFFDTLPLNTQSIKLNLGYEIGGCGNDFVLTQNGVWSQNGCDFYVRWDDKNGTLPYRWRFFYSSDGRTDYASHPTAGPDSLPKKGWSNGMTISENQL